MEIKALAELQKEFLASVREVRPRLHRFCTRMCGSALDGEDVVQETLAQAFFHLPALREPGRLEPWLFRIAHRKCIDFLRSHAREEIVADDDAIEVAAAGAALDEAPDDTGEPIGETLAPLVRELPPKERAAVLLKDILQYRLSEVAEVVESTVGGVKAALHRGRAKLRERTRTARAGALDAREQKLLQAYVDCFNRRDFDGLRALVAADARLEVVEAVDGKLGATGGTYFGNYAALPWAWRLSVARVDGQPALILWKQGGGRWQPRGAVRLWWQDGKVVRIRDYFHVEYLLGEADIEETKP